MLSRLEHGREAINKAKHLDSRVTTSTTTTSMVPRVLTWVLIVHSWCGYCVLTSYNGTTTLDQQASVTLFTSRGAPDRTSLYNRPHYRPPRPFGSGGYDTETAGGGTLGVYSRPPPGFFPNKRPSYHHQHSLHPSHPPKYYPYQDTSGSYGGHPEDYYYAGSESALPSQDACNVLGPLLALKGSMLALLKLASAKLPLLLLKLLAKGLAVMLILGPLLLPLVLLFPIPVLGYATFANGFGFVNGIGTGTANPNPATTIGRQIAALLPEFVNGPCLPRTACEMGQRGYKQQIAWILDHLHETSEPNEPQKFSAWKRAYVQGGRGRNCSALYSCPVMDKAVAAAVEHKLLPLY